MVVREKTPPGREPSQDVPTQGNGGGKQPSGNGAVSSLAVSLAAAAR